MHLACIAYFASGLVCWVSNIAVVWTRINRKMSVTLWMSFSTAQPSWKILSVLKLRRDLDFRIVRVRVQLHKKIGDRCSSEFHMLIAQIEGCGDRIKLDIKGRTAIQSRDRHVPASITCTGATKHLSFSLLGPTCRTCLDVASFCVQSRDTQYVLSQECIDRKHSCHSLRSMFTSTDVNRQPAQI
jgi:hypothetical protein